MALNKKTNMFTELLTELSAGLNNIDNKKEQILIEKMQEWIKYKNNLLELDTELNEYLYTTKNNNEIISDTDFQTKLADIGNNSLIIYIKKAQLYKIYNPENFQDFQNDDNTIYRKPEYGPIHEVVRDNCPQKLMIVVNDDIRDEQLTEIKTNIVDFIKKNPAFSKTTTNDLKIYTNDNSTEFVLTSLRLENLNEKDKLIEGFVRFLRNHGKQDLASKIQLRDQPSHIDGARFYKLPNAKHSLTQSSDTISQLISTASESKTPIIINNTYIINSNNINSNNTNSTLKNNNIKTEKKTLLTFRKFLEETKPEWYKENTLVDMSIIEHAYRTYFNDNTIKTTIISRQLNGILFDKGKRENGITKKLLLPSTK